MRNLRNVRFNISVLSNNKTFFYIPIIKRSYCQLFETFETAYYQKIKTSVSGKHHRFFSSVLLNSWHASLMEPNHLPQVLQI